MSGSTSPQTAVYEDQFSSRHDFPSVEVPTTYYVVASTPRCGSHLLGHTLYQTGVMGFPLEYFNPVNFPRWATRFGTQTFEETYEAIRAHRTSPNGCFGTKLHFSHFARLAAEHDFESLFPRARVVFIERDDLLGQAISLARARQTGSWISAQPTKGEPVYDAAAIDRALGDIVGANASWRLILGQRGWPHIRVTYEEFVHAPERVTREIAEFMGVDLRREKEQNVPLPERQGDRRNGEWRARYLEEPRAAADHLRISVDAMPARRHRRAGLGVRAVQWLSHVRSALNKRPAWVLRQASRLSRPFRSSGPLSMPRVSLLQGRLLRRFRALVPQRYVIIHGFYGSGNVGDEAILAATLDEVRRVTKLEPYVFAWNPERVREDFGVPSLDPNTVGILRCAGVLIQAEAYLLGGGGILKDYGGSPASLGRWLRWPEVAQALGVKTMLWSVGVENVLYEASKQRLRDVLPRLDILTVREDASRNRLQEVGITQPIYVTADPVPHFARTHGRLCRVAGRVRDGERVRVVVSLRHWYTTEAKIADADVFERFLGTLASGLDYLQDQHDAEIVFVPFRTAAGDDDRAIAAAVIERMRLKERVFADQEPPTVFGALQHVAAADLVVGMRLHAAVMATSLGIPTIAFSYMPKVADYMASIEQAAYCADIEEVSPGWLRAKFDDALANREAIAARLETATGASSERFRQNGQLLANLLNEKRT